MGSCKTNNIIVRGINHPMKTESDKNILKLFHNFTEICPNGFPVSLLFLLENHTAL